MDLIVLSIKQGHIDCVRHLVERIHDPQLPQRCLEYAVWLGHVDILEYLLTDYDGPLYNLSRIAYLR